MQPPDFIQIPREALVDPNLRPFDCILLGYIYWFTKLKNERCTAGNPVLAEITGLSIIAIQHALDRLEQGQYIERVFKDDSRRRRIEIICNVSFGRVRLNKHTRSQVRLNKHSVRLNKHTGQQIEVRLNKHQNKNKEEKLKRRENVDKKNGSTGLANNTAKTSGYDFANQIAKQIKQRNGEVGNRG